MWSPISTGAGAAPWGRVHCFPQACTKNTHIINCHCHWPRPCLGSSIVGGTPEVTSGVMSEQVMQCHLHLWGIFPLLQGEHNDYPHHPIILLHSCHFKEGDPVGWATSRGCFWVLWCIVALSAVFLTPPLIQIPAYWGKITMWEDQVAQLSTGVSMLKLHAVVHGRLEMICLAKVITKYG